MPQISPDEKFLYENFELLFSKEPSSYDETRIFRLEDRFSIIDSNTSGSSSSISGQDNGDKQKSDYLKLEFNKLRTMIDQMINAEQTMSGGNIPSLKYIKQYINDKIKNIIPRD
jgi:hypothetical protein